MTQFKQWPRALLGPAMPALLPFLDKIIAGSGGQHTVQSIASDVLADHAQLWVVWDDQDQAVRAVVLTDIYKASSGLKVASIRACAGQHRKLWVHHLSDLEAWARSQGCDKLETWARKGWARELPKAFKMTHVLLEKDLRHHGQVEERDADADADAAIIGGATVEHPQSVGAGDADDSVADRRRAGAL